MKTTASLIAACFTLCGNASASETLNIPAISGFAINPYCAPSTKGGLMHPVNIIPPCEIEFPVPLPAGRTIKQITLQYGSASAGRMEFDAQVYARRLATGPNITAVNYATGLGWWRSSAGLDPSKTYSANLMAQSGIPVTYPDAFMAEDDKAYFVHVMVRTLDYSGAEVFGLRVLYE